MQGARSSEPRHGFAVQLGKLICLPQTSIFSFVNGSSRFLPSHRAVCTDDGSSLVQLFEETVRDPVGYGWEANPQACGNGY